MDHINHHHRAQALGKGLITLGLLLVTSAALSFYGLDRAQAQPDPTESTKPTSKTPAKKPVAEPMDPMEPMDITSTDFVVKPQSKDSNLTSDMMPRYLRAQAQGAF